MKKAFDFLVITLGTLIISVGIYFFKFPNNFSTGGVSGISIILGSLVKGLSAGTFVLIINTLLLVVGFLTVGKDFGIKTVYCSLLMSLSIYILEKFVPMDVPLTGEPTLEIVFSILLPAVGSALLFNRNASTGGTDVVAMIIKKYTGLNISRSLFVSDFVIVMATVFVFGIETWLFSLIGFLAKVFVVNNLLESINTSKACTVITAPEHKEKILSYITDELHKSATFSDEYMSAYLHDKKTVMLVALDRRQARMLKNYIKKLDGKAFVIMNNTSDILGKGFRETV